MSQDKELEVKNETVAEDSLKDKKEAVTESAEESKGNNEKVDDTVEDNREEIDDDEIMDIAEAEKAVKEEAAVKNEKKHEVLEQKVGGKKAPKATEDFVKKQKRRKRRKRIIVLVILAVVIFFIVTYVRYAMSKAQEALLQMGSTDTQTATVEKKTLYESTNATGTLYSLESRTMTANLGTGVATIEAVNVEVGDIVEAGDILVEFSTEDIEKDIANKQEDIAQQKQIDAINAADDQRTYVNTYADAATSIQKAAKDVDRALFDLHEACNAYGDAKRALEAARSMSDDEFKEKYNTTSREAIYSSLENSITSAFQAQERAQKTYDDAVESQAQTINKAQTSDLSSADSKYQQSQLTSGKQVKQYQRELEKYKDSLSEYVVTASISGIVTEVNVSEGNRFSSGNVLTIQDNSGYKAEVLVDEYDIGKVKKAFNEAAARGEQLKVVVKTEATEDREFRGHVSSIAPTSTATATSSNSTSGGSGSASSSGSSSSVNYKVNIELDEIDDALMIGMSAKVAIVVDESPANALCVPYNAVEEKSDGTYVVRLMDEKYVREHNLSEGAGEEDAGVGVNGIVVENNNSRRPSSDFRNKSGSDKGGYFKWLFSKKDKNEEVEVDLGPQYKEITVNKLFETDFYAAVVPTSAGALNEGDTVMIVSDKSDGSDLMAMFGGPRGGGF